MFSFTEAGVDARCSYTSLQGPVFTCPRVCVQDADVRPHMAAISEQLRQEAAEGGAQQQGAEGEEEEEESGEEESGEEEDAFPPGPEYGAGQAVGEGAQQLKGGGR